MDSSISLSELITTDKKNKIFINQIIKNIYNINKTSIINALTKSSIIKEVLAKTIFFTDKGIIEIINQVIKKNFQKNIKNDRKYQI